MMLARAVVGIAETVTRVVFKRRRCNGCGDRYGPLPVRIRSSGEWRGFCGSECGRGFE